MNLQEELAISYYKTIAVIDDAHQVFLVQHRDTGKIFIKKVLDVYNAAVYGQLKENPVPGIPRIIEAVENDKQLIVIEEYISGVSLEEKIQNKDYSMEDCISYMTDLCDILQGLHQLNPPLIHRDIKPSNIMVTAYNRVILLDFNAAKYFTGQGEQDTRLLGTKGYAAPEQYGFGSSSPQTDIYALGIVLGEMLKAIDADDSKLRTIADKCAKLSPDQRYASAREVKCDLLSRQHSENQESKSNDNTGFLPPGFRSRVPWKMTLASLGYLFIFYISLTLQIENATPLKTWMERIDCLIMLLAIVCASCNYRGMQKIMPLCRSPRREIRFIGILLLDALLMFAVVSVLSFIEFFAFPV